MISAAVNLMSMVLKCLSATTRWLLVLICSAALGSSPGGEAVVPTFAMSSHESTSAVDGGYLRILGQSGGAVLDAVFTRSDNWYLVGAGTSVLSVHMTDAGELLLADRLEGLPGVVRIIVPLDDDAIVVTADASLTAVSVSDDGQLTMEATWKAPGVVDGAVSVGGRVVLAVRGLGVVTFALDGCPQQLQARGVWRHDDVYAIAANAVGDVAALGANRVHFLAVDQLGRVEPIASADLPGIGPSSVVAVNRKHVAIGTGAKVTVATVDCTRENCIVGERFLNAGIPAPIVGLSAYADGFMVATSGAHPLVPGLWSVVADSDGVGATLLQHVSGLSRVRCSDQQCLIGSEYGRFSLRLQDSNGDWREMAQIDAVGNARDIDESYGLVSIVDGEGLLVGNGDDPGVLSRAAASRGYDRVGLDRGPDGNWTIAAVMEDGGGQRAVNVFQAVDPLRVAHVGTIEVVGGWIANAEVAGDRILLATYGYPGAGITLYVPGGTGELEIRDEYAATMNDGLSGVKSVALAGQYILGLLGGNEILVLEISPEDELVDIGRLVRPQNEVIIEVASSSMDGTVVLLDSLTGTLSQYEVGPRMPWDILAEAETEYHQCNRRSLSMSDGMLFVACTEDEDSESWSPSHVDVFSLDGGGVSEGPLAEAMVIQGQVGPIARVSGAHWAVAGLGGLVKMEFVPDGMIVPPAEPTLLEMTPRIWRAWFPMLWHE